MSIEPERRSWAAPQRRERARKELRRRPYTPTQLSDHVDDLTDGMEDILYFLAALHRAGERAIKWGKVLGPLFIGALLASGVVTGPLGQILKYLAEHWPK